MSITTYPFFSVSNIRDYPDERSYFRAFKLHGELVPPYRTYNSDSDDSDSDDRGLPTPSPSVDLEWEDEQEKKRMWLQTEQEAVVQWEARKAKEGIYQRTRSRVIKNRPLFDGQDTAFWALDARGKSSYVESLLHHVRVSTAARRGDIGNEFDNFTEQGKS